MIVWISGLSCSGKSTIVKNIVRNQDDNIGDIVLRKGNLIEPTKHFDCIQFEDFTVIGGRYYSDQTNPGSDRIFAGADRFKDFIIQEYNNHKNFLIEGSRFFRKEVLDWLVSEYELKIFHIETDRSIIEERSKDRNGWWDKQRTDRRTDNELKKFDKILNDNILKQHITVYENNTMEDSKSITKNILKILLDKTC
tara:strand:+ start:42 stop:626 length:585 start_codon:yes stop_codon:yes gene_type:complete